MVQLVKNVFIFYSFRCLSQRWQRGGNAANNCTVLSLLGASPSFMGTIGDSHEKTYLIILLFCLWLNSKVINMIKIA